MKTTDSVSQLRSGMSENYGLQGKSIKHRLLRSLETTYFEDRLKPTDSISSYSDITYSVNLSSGGKSENYRPRAQSEEHQLGEPKNVVKSEKYSRTEPCGNGKRILVV